MAPGNNNLHWISTLGDINFIAYLLSTHLLMESTTWKIHYLVIVSPLKLSLKAIWWKWVHGIKISTNSEVKKYFQDEIVKKYDILYDFWPKSMIVWHLGQKYDVRRNVWRLAALSMSTVLVWITHGPFNRRICLTHCLLRFPFYTTKE